MCALGSGLWFTSASAFGSSVAVTPVRRLPVRKAAGGDTGQALQTQRQNLQTEHQERTTQLSEQEKVLAQTEEKRRRIPMQNGPKSPEELAVEKLRAEPITWESLAPQKQDAAELRRIFNTEGADLTKATALLAASRKAWQDQVREAITSGNKSKEQRIKSLKSMQQLFVMKSNEAMVVLNMDGLVTDDPVIAAVTNLLSTMTDGSRAIPGQNFTNSVGMDMVWVEEGGFWIGKTEVTSAVYQALRGEKGDDKPQEGIAHGGAVGDCKALNFLEQSEKNTLALDRRIKPANAKYDLPSVKQWLLASNQAAQLGMSGFSDSLRAYPAKDSSE